MKYKNITQYDRRKAYLAKEKSRLGISYWLVMISIIIMLLGEIVANPIIEKLK
jgi:hypothetical protein